MNDLQSFPFPLQSRSPSSSGRFVVLPDARDTFYTPVHVCGAHGVAVDWCTLNCAPGHEDFGTICTVFIGEMNGLHDTGGKIV